jgi:hypothetical protein
VFGRVWRRRGGEGAVQFCDGCGQVCTPGCRERAQRDRVRAYVATWTLPLR